MNGVDAVLTAFADDVGRDGPVTVAGGRTRWDLGGAVDAAARVLSADGGGCSVLMTLGPSSSGCRSGQSSHLPRKNPI